jgi:hypothetical protein
MEMAFSVEDRGNLKLQVVMHTAASPPADEWRRFEELIRKAKGNQGIYIDRMRVLVISDGGAPNTHQRHVMQNEIYEGRPVRMALLTNSLGNPVKRGIARALTWMNPGMLICAPDDLGGALRHLNLSHDFDAVWARCIALQAQLPPVQTLKAIAERLDAPVPAAKTAATATSTSTR